LEETNNKKLFELSDLLRELKDRKADLDDRLKAVNGEIEGIQGEMIEIMLTEELTSFARDGVTFSLAVTEYPGPVAERKDELWQQLRENGYGELFTVNSQTLRGLIGDLKADNNGELPEWLTNLIQPNEKSVIRLTKSRKLKS
jgi:hypothetical protein